MKGVSCNMQRKLEVMNQVEYFDTIIFTLPGSATNVVRVVEGWVTEKYEHFVKVRRFVGRDNNIESNHYILYVDLVNHGKHKWRTKDVNNGDRIEINDRLCSTVQVK